MRWLAATVGLLAATVALSGAIYARDLRPGGWHPPERELARSDAAEIARLITGGRCPGGCAVTALIRVAPGRWRARLRTGTAVHCATIDVDSFAFADRRGMRGATVFGCR